MTLIRDDSEPRPSHRKPGGAPETGVKFFTSYRLLVLAICAMIVGREP